MSEGKTVTAVGETAEEVAQVLRGLADGNRLRIIHLLLVRGELCVCDIEQVLRMTQTKVSRHLTFLRNAGLVHARRHGRWMHYRLNDGAAINRDLFAALAHHVAAVPEFASDAERLHSCCTIACNPQPEES